MGRIEDIKAQQAELKAQSAKLNEELKEARRAEQRAAREREAAERQAEADRMFQEMVEPHGMPRSVGDAVWHLAWEQGHSSGYREVQQHYGDFAELALKVWEAAGK